MGHIQEVPSILLLGATGYVGGTVLEHLLSSSRASLQDATPISVLVRGDERAAQLRQRYGDKIAIVAFKDLDETARVADVAARHDIVVNAGTGFHPAGARALVEGLARRKRRHPDSPAWMLHLSGCSNISDRPLTGRRHDAGREWRDGEGAREVFDWELAQNRREWYPQRAAELEVLATAEDAGVNALSLQAPCIFGKGEGMFNQAGLMIPIMTTYVLSHGYGFSLGDGTGAIDIVHVADLAALFALLAAAILEARGDALPRGRAGIVFPENGRVSMYQIAEGCVDAAFDAGVLPQHNQPGGWPREREIRTVDLDEAATTTAGNRTVAEVGWAGHRLTKGVVARQLGWAPVHGIEAWKKDLRDELQAALEGRRGVTIDSCIAEREEEPAA
ncbi:NAD dependent epimerase/dehydratase [Xylariomycetidae sp. FL0641]|nr:NAD dependent epimerase/dehydratase [Xylariomycetidae sp. FL0641]